MVTDSKDTNIRDVLAVGRVAGTTLNFPLLMNRNNDNIAYCCCDAVYFPCNQQMADVLWVTTLTILRWRMIKMHRHLLDDDELLILRLLLDFDCYYLSQIEFRPGEKEMKENNFPVNFILRTIPKQNAYLSSLLS